MVHTLYIWVAGLTSLRNFRRRNKCGTRLQTEKTAEAGSWTPAMRANGHLPWNCGVRRPLAWKSSTVRHMHAYLHSSRHDHMSQYSTRGWPRSKSDSLAAVEQLAAWHSWTHFLCMKD